MTDQRDYLAESGRAVGNAVAVVTALGDREALGAVVRGMSPQETADALCACAGMLAGSVNLLAHVTGENPGGLLRSMMRVSGAVAAAMQEPRP